MSIIILLGSEINVELNENETCDTHLTDSNHLHTRYTHLLKTDCC